MDVLTKQQRSYAMSQIKRDKTRPELILKNVIRGLGFSYQPKMYGNPDFANKGKKIVIFVDGCFWHMCPKCFKMPKTNSSFWRRKLEGNKHRDRERNTHLRRAGWTVFRVYEHEIKRSSNTVVNHILSLVKSSCRIE
jgi:DNA mismatch endonuclease (patch repair protein)